MILLVLVAAGVFAADRVSKLAVQSMLPVNHSRPLLGDMVLLTHTENTGAAFSLGHGMSWLFLVFSVAVAIAIVWYYPRVSPSERLMRLAMALILGGDLGNAFDRLLFRSVTDFILSRQKPGQHLEGDGGDPV
jgi:signal peptidase II